MKTKARMKAERNATELWWTKARIQRVILATEANTQITNELINPNDLFVIAVPHGSTSGAEEYFVTSDKLAKDWRGWTLLGTEFGAMRVVRAVPAKDKIACYQCGQLRNDSEFLPSLPEHWTPGEICMTCRFPVSPTRRAFLKSLG